MSDFEKFVKLLAQTDGRDKIYKFIGGLLKVLTVLDGCQPRTAAYKAIGCSIAEGRLLMRMAKWAGDVPKMRSIITQYQLKGELETKKVIEFLRILGNFLYVLGDNYVFFSRYKLIPFDYKYIQFQSKVAQFWGFFFAVVLDLIALQAALMRRTSDALTSRKEVKAALINLTKDGADMLVTMAAVGFMKSVWNPATVTSGALTTVSGAIATYLNWKKIK